MGTIIQMPTTHISSEKRGGLPKEFGYNQIPETIIAEFFKVLRGGGGPDAFIIKLYQPNGNNPMIGKLLMHGCVPPDGKLDYSRIRKSQRNLEDELDAKASEAFRTIKERTSRIFQFRHHENNMVFVKSTKGLIACGWYDSANSSQKGLMMASYMLYAFGAINQSADQTLYNAVYRYLPFESGVFTSVEAERAEKIILKYLSDWVLAGKN